MDLYLATYCYSDVVNTTILLTFMGRGQWTGTNASEYKEPAYDCPLQLKNQAYEARQNRSNTLNDGSL